MLLQGEIELETLARRRKKARVELIMKISNDAHSSSIKDFDGITVQQTAFHPHNTRSVAFYSNANTFYHDFVQRASRDIRLTALP